MVHSPETMQALADTYSSALRKIMLDAIDDGFWFGSGSETDRSNCYSDIDMNWGAFVSEGGYRTLIEGEA